MRVVVWVQHLLGTGHTVRAAAVARALRDRGATVTMVLGARPPATLDLDGLDVRQLPPVLSRDATFRILEGEDGVPYAALRDARRAMFAAVLADVQPDALLMETFPLGRNMMAAEVEPVLEAERARPRPPLIAVSVRDVLARKTEAKAAAMVARAERLVDVVLVHGDPAFVPLEASFPAIAALQERVRYTGYVDAGRDAPPSAEAAGAVVLSAGGGRSALGLVCLASAAANGVGADVPWRVLVPDPAAVLQNVAVPAHMTVEKNRADFRALLGGAALSVSQAGYNTVLDVMAAGCRAVFVPFAEENESEQTDRAEALAARGLATVVRADAAPQVLAHAVRETLSNPLPARPPLDTNGAAQAADILVAAARHPTAKARDVTADARGAR